MAIGSLTGAAGNVGHIAHGGARTRIFRLSDRSEPLSDLNTTPLIDVLLVLLIMFIITIPPQTHAIDVALPGGVGTSHVHPVANRLTIAPDGLIRWNGSAIDLVTLHAYLAETRRLNPEPELQFQPDAAARYETVDQALAVIRRSGVAKLGFVGNERYRDF